MIHFFPSNKGHLVSHHSGLTFAQIQWLKTLKVGHHLIIYANDDGSTTMKQFPNEVQSNQQTPED